MLEDTRESRVVVRKRESSILGFHGAEAVCHDLRMMALFLEYMACKNTSVHLKITTQQTMTAAAAATMNVCLMLRSLLPLHQCKITDEFSTLLLL